MAIQPAVEAVKAEPGDQTNSAARANAKMVAEQLKASTPILAALVRRGRLKVVPAYYDLESGSVEILS